MKTLIHERFVKRHRRLSFGHVVLQHDVLRISVRAPGLPTRVRPELDTPTAEKIRGYSTHVQGIVLSFEAVVVWGKSI